MLIVKKNTMRDIKFIYTVIKPACIFHSKPMTIEQIENGDAATFLKMNGVLPSRIVCRRQFTGLQDKNGTDIYEGNLVNIAKWGDTVKVVKWIPHHMTYGLCFPDGNTDTYFVFTQYNIGGNTLQLRANELEVIGNIHDTNKPQ